MTEQHAPDVVFALDIGTRSIIGLVGRPEGEHLRVLAIEKEEHGKRAMLDGQIEDIEQVSKVARRVTDRLEAKLGFPLRQVCVAAAGRALRTERGRYNLRLPEVQRVTSELINQLESSAVSQAEETLSKNQTEHQRFYLVGYTVSSYQLDHYPLTTLKGHNGQELDAEVVATFLPSEVVESLYAVMEGAGLEVSSLTLEPIAALNAVIPAELRLLNLVLADIGAGTSDIAVCREGSVVGYTMATTAGDEITENLMRRYLVDFKTAERMKMEVEAPEVTYRDVLGLEQTLSGDELREVVQQSAQVLAKEISERVLQINEGQPSALFLAGGGSKLSGLRDLVAKCLDMDPKRVALAGNNYQISAISDEYELADPELATPLGIAVSAGLGLISDSYRITLNGKPAKLFRSGSLRILDILLMNGYTTADLVGRTGMSLNVTVNGQRCTFRGTPAVPSALTLNGEETPPTAVVRAGDVIEFTPAVQGVHAARTLRDILGGDFVGSIMVNGQEASLDTALRSGDVILSVEYSVPPRKPEPVPEPAPAPAPPVPAKEPEEPALRVSLNGIWLALPPKADGTPYYLMDMLDYSGMDFESMDQPVDLLVNGEIGAFMRVLEPNDEVLIRRQRQES